MSGARRARVELHADPSKLGRGLGVASAKLATFGKDAQKKLWPAPPPGRMERLAGAAGRAAQGGLAKVGRGAASALARSFDPLGMGFGLLEASAGEALQFERAMARMAIAQDKGLDEMDDFRTSIVGLSSDTGIARNELMAGAAAYQALTGDTKGSVAAVQTFARVSKATGTSMEDVAAAGASLAQNLKVDPAQLEEVFSIIASQGKAGAVELHELASLLPSISAKFQSFSGGTGSGGVTEMSAALQIVKRSFGSAAQAGTGMEALMGELVKKNKKLAKAGVKVFDQGKLRGFSEIIQDIGESKVLQGEGALEEVFGSKEAIDAVKALTANYGDFRGLVEKTDVKTIGKDFDKYMASPAGKMERSWNNIKLSIAKALTPERIEAFARGMDLAVKGIEFIVEAIEKIQAWVSAEEDISTGEMVGQVAARAKKSAAQAVDPGAIGWRGQKEGYDMGFMFEAGAGYMQAQRAPTALAATAAALTVPLLEPLRRIEERLRKAPVVQVNSELKTDGVTTAKAVASSASNRTRPGGN